METEECVSFDHEESMAGPHAGPGIMLLTASMQLLYKDRRAWELCEQIIRCQDGKTAKGVLPPAIASLVNEIRNILQVRKDPKDWEQLELRHIVSTLHRPVLICGMAVIAPNDGGTRILIVMNEVRIGAWQDKVIVQARETFHLTARETTVVQHLLKGWTNKEIANEMRLAEQTIKEYFKHISEKMSTTTRTGIAMTIIYSGLPHALATPSPHVMVPTMSGRPFELVASA